jgi:hypothetical protein
LHQQIYLFIIYPFFSRAVWLQVCVLHASTLDALRKLKDHPVEQYFTAAGVDEQGRQTSQV